ncbi:MAG: DUF1566 domain-containing protein [Geobacter sp.]|nr:DUF1566 domain-containing protein [Geobacter sp.]
MSHGDGNATARLAKPAAPEDKSIPRRKELEAIARVETAAAELNRKEGESIRKVQAELDEIDRQIAAMKSRLESGKPRANDRADAIKAMSAYKAEHAAQLEELRRQHKSSEQKRLAEVNKLKNDFKERWRAAIYAAADRYQQVATNKYLRHKKDAAWEFLIAEFSEAGAVKRHDVAAYLTKLGVPLLPGLDQACHIDRENGLMWVKSGNLSGKAMSWSAAVNWASALDYGGYSDWRLPTASELEGLAKSGGQRPAEFLNKSGYSNVQAGLYWSSTAIVGAGGSLYRNVSMMDGSLEESSREKEFHVWPVRETGAQKQKIRLEA